MKKVFDFITNFDPAILGEMTPEELAEVYRLLSDTMGIIEAIKRESGQVLLTKFEGDGKVFGQYAVNRAKMPNYSKVDMEKAREFGATKEVLDTTLIGNLIKKGAKIDGVTYSFYPRVTKIEDKEEKK